MQQVKLGRTDLEVSVIGIGGMPMSLSGRPDEATSVAAIHRALELGVTFIDTADAYCIDEGDKHHNETLIARALASFPGDTSKVVVATKGGLMRHEGRWPRNGDPAHLRKTIRESHAALGGERPLDLWQLHAPDPDFAIEESLAAAREAVADGLVRYVGVSNFDVSQIEQARAVIDIVSVQNQHNPWHRKPEEDGVLAYCEREGLTFLPWSPFGGRQRAAKLGDSAPVLLELAEELEATPHQVMLAWLRALSPCILPIPGISKAASAEGCAAAAALTLNDAQRGRLDAQLRVG
jgi:aryl-alcohol dehydrogenase-like predicted oxidoreductase